MDCMFWFSAQILKWSVGDWQICFHWMVEGWVGIGGIDSLNLMRIVA